MFGSKDKEKAGLRGAGDAAKAAINRIAPKLADIVERFDDNGFMIGVGPGGIRLWVPSDAEAQDNKTGDGLIPALLSRFAQSKGETDADH